MVTTSPSSSATTTTTKKIKEKIPKALREQVWIRYCGKTFEHKCLIPWCKNKINPFDFHVGHDIPESKGGSTTIDNLQPICARCNLSMSDDYTISEWVKFAGPTRCCFGLFVMPWSKPTTPPTRVT
jgi:5-methylcytosine-specific restriction endonuclease McrA